MFRGEGIYKCRLIRFRRWSRNNFAIFAGLKANIAIGCLSKDIVDRLLPKTKSIGAYLTVNSILSSKEAFANGYLCDGHPSVNIDLVVVNSVFCAPSSHELLLSAQKIELATNLYTII